MVVDYLIVGQGLCGTMLSWFLEKEGKSFVVIDDDKEQSASKTAAGIINPVTGRRYAYAWMIDEVMPFALQTYREMGRSFGMELIVEKDIIDFFPSPQMRSAFIGRLEENDTYLHAYPDQNHLNASFHYDFGCGAIRPAYALHVQPLLQRWRSHLKETGCLLEAVVDPQTVRVKGDGVAYGSISAQKIIWCEGAAGTQNPWFGLLPYAPNKGEALLIECEGLDPAHVYKRGMLLAPTAEKNIYWLGSNYQWSFENDLPSDAFFQQANALLKGWLKKPYEILSHKAAVRPATVERRPFVGLHPLQSGVAILNGMGTKGASLAPFFAGQLAQHLVHGRPIDPAADIKRFKGILSKSYRFDA